MSLLKKSLLISLVIHALLLLLFSAVVVTRQVVRWVRNEPMTPSVNLQLSRKWKCGSRSGSRCARRRCLPPRRSFRVNPWNRRSRRCSNKSRPSAHAGMDRQQLAATRNPVAPTIPQAPPASDLTTPLLPVQPQLAPFHESTPLPVTSASIAEQARLPGPVNERLGRETSPIIGFGTGSLGAPPAALPQGNRSGGVGSGSGTGRPLSLLTQTGAPDGAVAMHAVPPPIIPEIGTPQPGTLLPQRRFDDRQKSLQRYGGTAETEAAVARALAYLSRMQQPDGHWTKIMDNDRERTTDAHDTALTGLSLLAFLASDHTPDKPGPYQSNVQRAVAYLMLREGRDGDLRGDGNMYDQGIASLALNEAAAMSRDGRIEEAAHRAAQFILNAQNGAGGWRYSPRDLFSDTSVMGWQVMALHSAERTGFSVPDRVKEKVFGYLDGVSSGNEGVLAGYLTRLPSTTMTAEATFSRLLLGQSLDDAKLQEVSQYLINKLPSRDPVNFYYMYYGSLALMQVQGDRWRQWNAQTSALLVALQDRAGETAGSFSTDSEWGSRGGRVYTTAMATLTLEVYYRYAPMNGAK